MSAEADPERAAPPAGTPRFVAYPRGYEHDPLDQLEAIVKAYRGLNRVFVISVVLNAVTIGLFMQTTAWPAGRAALVTTGLLAAVGTYLQLQRLEGVGVWSLGRIIVASLVMGVNTFLCGGILEFAVIQDRLTAEMKRLGVRTGFLGPSSVEIARVSAELRDRPPPPAWTPPPE